MALRLRMEAYRLNFKNNGEFDQIVTRNGVFKHSLNRVRAVNIVSALTLIYRIRYPQILADTV
jgi:hypothetical protein